MKGENVNENQRLWIKRKKRLWLSFKERSHFFSDIWERDIARKSFSGDLYWGFVYFLFYKKKFWKKIIFTFMVSIWTWVKAGLPEIWQYQGAKNIFYFYTVKIRGGWNEVRSCAELWGTFVHVRYVSLKKSQKRSLQKSGKRPMKLFIRSLKRSFAETWISKW